MPFYKTSGKTPDKRHTQFRDNQKNLYWEELVSRNGFSCIYSNLYHLNPPTSVKKIGPFKKIKLFNPEIPYRHHHIKTSKLKSKGTIISSRVPLFFNSDIIIYKAHVNKTMSKLYKNGHADEILFIHSGRGILKTNFGNINLIPGDYVIIPRGVIWKMTILEKIEALVIESKGQIETPQKYRNKFGQLMEHSPFCERDIRTPEFVEPINSENINIDIKLELGMQEYIYKHHPFDLIGWDGYYFPWVFNINDFMPITGKIHQPPPVHQTFQSNGFVVCSFVPRLFDYHELAVPAPYAHSNLDSDEIIFYSGGEFMSRKNIEEGSITYHPSGIPHGPQPGKIEKSIGINETNELAVMIDTFKPLKITEEALNVDDVNYPKSWLKK